MVFPTIEFAAFFLGVFVVSWLLMPKPPLWKPFMLAASYLFYAYADWRFVFLLFGSTVFNQAMAEVLYRVRAPRLRARMMVLAVGGNLAVLGWFKYYNFFLDSVTSLLDTLHLPAPLPLLQVALPVAISFFTFQALSYVIDVHRGLIKPAKPIDFAVYLSFFPHLVAGPIVRASEFIPQLSRPRDPREIPATRAFFLIGGGLIKKIVIADLLAAKIVDPVFNTPGQHSALEILVGVYGYAIQIFCDFSAYSEIAIGVALLLGYRFPENFDAPYTAVSLQDFWRRWHMSLSRFLRDYLYIPLGGNRGSEGKTRRNLMVTMLLGGLWHGAGWNFMLWGGLHGAGLSAERALAGRRLARGLLPRPDTAGRRLLGRLVTFHLVCLAWIPFRAADFATVREMLSRLFTAGGPAPLVTPSVLALIALGLLVQYVPRDATARLQHAFAGWGLATQAAALGLTVFLADALGNQGVAPFIYFRF